jgi:hypothetical protein
MRINAVLEKAVLSKRWRAVFPVIGHSLVRKKRDKNVAIDLRGRIMPAIFLAQETKRLREKP